MTKSSMPVDVAIIGGGAAGFFAAVTVAENNPDLKIVILEKSAKLLSKVRISGGGRCNVTHACFDPAELVSAYPRGGRELRGPFSRFQPEDTVTWFESRGVPLKTEKDGRMFPQSDSSASIVDVLQQSAEHAGVKVLLDFGVREIEKTRDGFLLKTDQQEVAAKQILLAPGGGHKAMALAEGLGHTLSPPVPSLFTLGCKDPRLADLSGVSVDQADLHVQGFKPRKQGPFLITHWGFSGPALITLSAWLARDLAGCDYRATLVVNWLGQTSTDQAQEVLNGKRKETSGQEILGLRPWRQVPRRLWQRLCFSVGIKEGQRWSDLSKQQARDLAEEMTAGKFPVSGMSSFKEEFVTCGGVLLKEVNLKTMESRKAPGLFFAGEVLDIDGVTGGFNFQAAWTTAYLAGMAIGNRP